MPNSVPPLPAQWPFEGRPLPILETHDEFSLPGLGNGWEAVLPTDFVLADPIEPLGQAFGRGGVRRCGDAVLRPYRRGGLVRFVNARIYPGPKRFLAELEVHRTLWRAGFPTVEPLGCAWRRLGWGVEGVYFTRFQPGTPWPRTWDSAALPQIQRLVEALAAWGLWAPDLNATNFLVADDGQVLALDWDKADWIPGVDLRPRYRERLLRSLRKLGAPDEMVQTFI